MFVELEFSTLENLQVKKRKLEIKEDNYFLKFIESPNVILGFFFEYDFDFFASDYHRLSQIIFKNPFNPFNLWLINF